MGSREVCTAEPQLKVPAFGDRCLEQPTKNKKKKECTHQDVRYNQRYTKKIMCSRVGATAIEDEKKIAEPEGVLV